ncbi:unnamed protein product [Adineta steineri]|uniref:Uncharacterized protein n=1 Tax=Adineta steineri TaxID=433720 RepID=A0A814WNN5_9BILA|nr:unnamed protein product [Adineta steineri]CAF1477330.1 unnamed protein product [Adineta steineri]
MEFDSFNLDTIVMDLLGDGKSTSDRHNSTHSLETTTQQLDNNRQYTLIIFNNPKWSRILKKKSEHIKQEHTQNTAHQPTTTVIKQEEQSLSLDDHFINQLRQLLKDYMQHTKRPFPLKYFIDLTD